MREHDSDWISFFPDPCDLQQSAALQLRHDHVTVKPAWLQVEVGLDAPVVGNITHVTSFPLHASVVSVQFVLFLSLHLSFASFLQYVLVS